MAIFFAIPLLTLLIVSGAGVFKKLLALLGIMAGALFTQSLAVYITFGIGAGIILIGHLAITAKRPMLAVILGVPIIPLGLIAINSLITNKIARNAVSVSDRGIVDSSIITETSQGNINIIVAFGNNPALAVALCAALFLAGVIAVRSIAGFGAYFIFAMTAVFAQPVQWQFGGWALLFMAILLPILGTRHQSQASAGIEAGFEKIPALSPRH